MTDELSPKIIFEDKNVMVIDKPAGLLSQGAKKNEKNVVDWCRQYLGRHYVGLIHRLDRNTSGIMVIAKRTKAAQRLTKALQEGNLKRTYLAMLDGTIKQSATWKHRLLKDNQKNVVKVVLGKEGKEAALNLVPIKTLSWMGNPLSLVHITLDTGRSHQIRVQAAYEGHPVIGDPKYNKKPSAKFGRLGLHSHQLEFPHPISGDVISLEAPLPPELAKL